MQWETAVFNLQFPMSSVGHWASLYTAEDDDAALQAGAQIRAGEFTRQNLERIVVWKSPRPLKRIRANTDAEIAEALRVAATAQEPRTAVSVLLGLNGVAVPMASAILTAIHPDDYTVIDFRAMEALGAPDYSSDCNFYLTRYLPECKRLAKDAGTSLRTLDRALWSWSKHKQTQPA
jgi:hypothetical protein